MYTHWSIYCKETRLISILGFCRYCPVAIRSVRAKECSEFRFDENSDNLFEVVHRVSRFDGVILHGYEIMDHSEQLRSFFLWWEFGFGPLRAASANNNSHIFKLGRVLWTGFAFGPKSIECVMRSVVIMSRTLLAKQFP
jgi:hypothetical protein